MEGENITREGTENIEQPHQTLTIPIKFNMDVNLGINLSIVLILMIFSGLLFLPSKMLLDTSYDVPQNQNDKNGSFIDTSNFLYSMKFREKKLCPGLNYEYWLSSIFFSNGDRNCTYTRKRGERMNETIVIEKNRERSVCTSEKKKMIIPYNYNGTIDEVRTSRPKSIPVTTHILAMMLIVSAVAALVEVIRIRFINPKDTPTIETAGSRKGSTVELMFPGRFTSREAMKSQRSFELQGMNRSALRLLGARPPPLLRRSSFPTYQVSTMELATNCDTPASRTISRRTSINVEQTIDSGMSTLHRRARLIRRH